MFSKGERRSLLGWPDFGWDSPQFLQNVAQHLVRLEGPSAATGRTRRIIVRYKETGSPSQPERVGVSARERERAGLAVAPSAAEGQKHN